jgi:hypothetical protein
MVVPAGAVKMDLLLGWLCSRGVVDFSNTTKILKWFDEQQLSLLTAPNIFSIILRRTDKESLTGKTATLLQLP